MTTPKLTPDQLHRLIDEVAELAYGDNVLACDIGAAAWRAECHRWWHSRGEKVYFDAAGTCHTEGRFAGLSAVLILLSEGG